MGKLQYFLGMEFSSKGNTGNYILSQHQYTHDLLRCTNMQLSKSAPTPMTSTMKLNASDGVPFTNKLLYYSTIGALLYLVNTRLDIAFVVN